MHDSVLGHRRVSQPTTGIPPRHPETAFVAGPVTCASRRRVPSNKSINRAFTLGFVQQRVA